MPKTLEDRLDAHPELKAQILTLLDIAESDIEKADEVELRTVESIRGVGQQVMYQWAEQQAQKKSDAARDQKGPELIGKGKKTLLDNDTRRNSRDGAGLQMDGRWDMATV